MKDLIHSKQHFYHWAVLSFLAGCINVGGYMACRRFVTHVTGFATLFGVDVANSRWTDAMSIISVPLFFIMGAMISALLTDRRLQQNKKPLYTLAMGLVMLCIFFAGFGGWSGWFGPFDHELIVKKDYFFLALLCTASGIQNAIVTSYSGALVRTTHLTGITTDLGIGFIRLLFPTPDEGQLKQEKRLMKLRIGTISCFIAGSAIGAVVFSHYDYLGFLLPMVLALYSIFAAHRIWRKF